MPNKEEAIAAIKAANPNWSEKHINFAYEMMPSSNAIFHDQGSPKRTYWAAYHQHHWTRWAIEMNILPQGTEVPPMPGGTTPVATMNAVARSVANSERRTQNGITEPREGTIARRIWDMAAGLKDPTVEAAVAEGTRLGLNIGNVRTEFSTWRKFNKTTT